MALSVTRWSKFLVAIWAIWSGSTLLELTIEYQKQKAFAPQALCLFEFNLNCQVCPFMAIT